MLKIFGESKMSKADEGEVFGFALFLGFALGSVLGFITGCSVAGAKTESLRVEAIRTGHAEYSVDEYGQTTFKFKD